MGKLMDKKVTEEKVTERLMSKSVRVKKGVAGQGCRWKTRYCRGRCCRGSCCGKPRYPRLYHWPLLPSPLLPCTPTSATNRIRQMQMNEQWFLSGRKKAEREQIMPDTTATNDIKMINHKLLACSPTNYLTKGLP